MKKIQMSEIKLMKKRNQHPTSFVYKQKQNIFQIHRLQKTSKENKNHTGVNEHPD